MHVAGAVSIIQRGQDALDNCLLEEFNNLPDEAYAMLDRVKVGEQFREQDGGTFVEGGYLRADPMDDFDYPQEEPVSWIEVRFRCGELESGWHEVPKSSHDERVIASFLDCQSLDGLDMDCRSLIPHLNGLASGADELPELRLLDEALNGMSGEEIQKYRALLEVIQPGTASAALRLADEMGLYEVEISYADPAAYGRGVAEVSYDLSPDDPLFKHIDFAGLGAELLQADGFVSTRYGAVYRNPMVQQHLSGPNTLSRCVPFSEGDVGFPADVCWDPDVQKMWLELNDESDHSNFALHQNICNDWGIRHCETQEEYEQILGEMEAQFLSEDQGFGGMGAMA